MTTTNELPTKIIDISSLVAKFQANAPKDAIEIIRTCMEFAESTKMTGPEKSELVKDLLTEPALVAVLPTRVVSAIELLISNDLVGPTIDTIVSAAHGQFDLKKTATCCLVVLSKFFSKTS